jgi:hypothetical protein
MTYLQQISRRPAPQLDVVGFDTATRRLIAEFSRGAL